MVVGHVAPEAAVGGPIALIEEGDTITIDAHQQTIRVHLTDEELAARRMQWQPPAPRHTRGVLGKFARLVSCASTGALTDIPREIHGSSFPSRRPFRGLGPRFGLSKIRKGGSTPVSEGSPAGAFDGGPKKASDRDTI